ncbi:protein ycf2 [Phtheirospermum japonicum]|uniref:Protein ycf2 n=1 Tax=Phtheirospermum japonicum TaxID=374723 RepID=A0A830C927_9LAMI|nr:protein ycf2 [Phtheirospermum japonicum]
MNWDFLIGPGNFGASGSFIMKRMSFNRMIQSSCRVEPCCNTSKIIFILIDLIIFFI